MANKRITDVDFVESLDSNESFFVNKNNTIKQINKGNVVFGVSNGGTGATTAEKARENLGITLSNIGAKASGTVESIKTGGTGATTAEGAIANLGGVKKTGDTMTGELTVPRLWIENTDWAAMLSFGNEVKEIGGVYNRVDNNSIWLYAKSPNADYGEHYWVATPESGLKENKHYDILSTKAAVTVKQGGTGATTAEKARENLGIPNFVSSKISSAISGLNAVTFDLLWQNESFDEIFSEQPSSFAEQTLWNDYSKYNAIFVIAAIDTYYYNQFVTCMFVKGTNMEFPYVKNTMENKYRRLFHLHDNRIYISSCYDSSNVICDDVLIPCQIYGLSVGGTT